MPNKQVLCSSWKRQSYWWIEFSPTRYCCIEFTALFLINRECPELLAMTVLKVGHKQTCQWAEFIREAFAGALIHYPSIADTHFQWEHWAKVPNTSRWHSGSQRKGGRNLSSKETCLSFIPHWFFSPQLTGLFWILSPHWSLSQFLSPLAKLWNPTSGYAI